MDDKLTNLGDILICGTECEHHHEHEEEMHTMMRRFEVAPKIQQQKQSLQLLQPNLLPQKNKCPKSSCSSSLSQGRVVV